MRPQLVVADASVALKWFHSAGEEEVQPSRALLEAYARNQIDLVILDLVVYEIGDVLVRRAGAGPKATATVLEALTQICQATALSGRERTTAARLASEHDLTFHDAAYAAVALERGGRLVTMNRKLIRAGLGVRPEHAFDQEPDSLRRLTSVDGDIR